MAPKKYILNLKNILLIVLILIVGSLEFIFLSWIGSKSIVEIGNQAFNIASIIMSISNLESNIAIGLVLNIFLAILCLMVLATENVFGAFRDLIEFLIISSGGKKKAKRKTKETTFWKQVLFLFGLSIICLMALVYIS